MYMYCAAGIELSSTSDYAFMILAYTFLIVGRVASPSIPVDLAKSHRVVWNLLSKGKSFNLRY